MKNFLCLMAAFFISVSLFSQEAASYFMFQNVYITPKSEHLTEFSEAMANHNKTYHNSGPFSTSVYQVISGPNFGKVLNSSGPHTWADVDARNPSKAHNEDWENNVMPYVAAIEDGGNWTFAPDLSYMPEGASHTKLRMAFMEIASGEGYRYNAVMKKLAETTKMKLPTQARMVFNRRGFHSDMRDRVIVFGLNNWADMDNNLGTLYEEVHGDGSWQLFLEEVEEVILSSEEELVVRSAEMSGN